mmetsp:Transcript_5442/g.7353  ORF Transcript_5442/g.7353 Transcript_5442/m.7353 type:complete len:129 (+) Transcript_5442:79-465(+)
MSFSSISIVNGASTSYFIGKHAKVSSNSKSSSRSLVCKVNASKTYKVAPGDCVYSISKKMNVPVNDVIDANPSDFAGGNITIYPAQELIIPGGQTNGGALSSVFSVKGFLVLAVVLGVVFYKKSQDEN